MAARVGRLVLNPRLAGVLPVHVGLLEGRDYSDEGRTRKAYVATDAAAELLPVLQRLAVWGERHTKMPEGGAHMAMIHEPCGQGTLQGQICSNCGEVLVSEEMVWVKPG